MKQAGRYLVVGEFLGCSDYVGTDDMSFVYLESVRKGWSVV